MEERVKLSTGIEGLDEMLYGGIPRESIVGLVGPAGSGKTIISLQFLYASLKEGKKCLYISASHDEKELISNSKLYGWDFEPYIEEKKLILKFIKPVKLIQEGMESRLVSDYLEELPYVVNQTEKEVVIIDSITDFLMLCKTDIERRSRLINLFHIIKESKSTALLTAESEIKSDSTKNGILEYVVDSIILLRRIQSTNLSELLHVIQVVKLRWNKHLREIRQFDFTDKGIVVYSKYDVLLGDMHGE
jgi:KaiC/GvpD/RAD55 family RecA-like ATPase